MGCRLRPWFLTNHLDHYLPRSLAKMTPKAKLVLELNVGRLEFTWAWIWLSPATALLFDPFPWPRHGQVIDKNDKNNAVLPIAWGGGGGFSFPSMMYCTIIFTLNYTLYMKFLVLSETIRAHAKPKFVRELLDIEVRVPSLSPLHSNHWTTCGSPPPSHAADLMDPPIIAIVNIFKMQLFHLSSYICIVFILTFNRKIRVAIEYTFSD